MRRAAPSFFFALAVAAAVPDAASAGATVTGTEGRDEVTIQQEAGPAIRIFGAATVTGDNCFANTDPLTGRTTFFRCPSTQLTSVSLGGGDDVLVAEVNHPDTITASVTVDGGPGADNLRVTSRWSRTIRGGDGDDTIAAPPGSLQNGDANTVLDGGAGRDLVDYIDAAAVNASLPGKSATVRLGVAASTGGPGQVGGQVVNRTDSLDSIERVSGSPNGDILTGSGGPDELLGAGGPDDIKGAAGADIVDGGPGVDDIDGGDGPDVITGGPGNDRFGKPTGDDTINSRDGFIEEIGCAKADVIVSDLVDKLGSPALCASVSVAAAKHAFDTELVALRTGPKAVIACPEEKTEPCTGRLVLRAGGDRGGVLARARYSVREGARKTVPLRVRKLPANRAATLQGFEVDADKRPRSLSKRVTLRGS